VIPVIGGTTDDRRLLRLAGLALPAAVWVLGVFSPPRGGLSPEYLATFSALLAALVAVDQTAPREDAGPWRRLLWLGAELALCWLVVRLHGTLIRPALIYLLPASRALLMFPRRGLALSLLVWLAYGLNVGLDAWPDRLGEYFPNYFSFFLAPYVVAVVLTLATLRQVADRRRVQALYDELRGAHEQLQTLHRRARDAAVAEERNRLAREIHDSLAHYLTVINVQLEAAEKLGPAQPRALESVRRARRLALECLREVRRSVAALRAATLEELSLPRAVDKLAREFAESTGIAVELRLAAPDDVRLAPEAAQALYRVAQEGLTNVQRHARAATVCLSLAAHNGGVELAVQDDGVGPSAESGHATDGFGLLGLRERVELLGGRLSFGRAPSGGSRLAASVPADGGR
jgi:signal transduction histidine kinase